MISMFHFNSLCMNKQCLGMHRYTHLDNINCKLNHHLIFTIASHRFVKLKSSSRRNSEIKCRDDCNIFCVENSFMLVISISIFFILINR